MDNVIGNNLKKYNNVTLVDAYIGNDVVLGEDAFIKACKIGDRVSIDRRNILVNSEIGDYTYTGYNCVIKHTTIGKFCSISWNVSIGGANHDITHLTTHPFPLIAKFGLTEVTDVYKSYADSLVIGNDVWIGSNSSVLRGVTVADGAVIGAGGVVTHDVGPYEIWAGVPARKIGQRYEDRIIEQLLQIKWYDYPRQFLIENCDLFKRTVTIGLIEELKHKYNEYLKRG